MIYVLCGPPGSGKTTYAREHMKHGDIIIDLDIIYQAFSGLPIYRKPDNLLSYMLDIHKFAIEKLIKNNNTFIDAYIIISGARKSDREFLRSKLDAEVVILDVEAGECLRRIESDISRKASVIPWGRIIKTWWNEYEPPK